jgi:hypothetical protein
MARDPSLPDGGSFDTHTFSASPDLLLPQTVRNVLGHVI